MNQSVKSSCVHNPLSWLLSIILFDVSSSKSLFTTVSLGIIIFDYGKKTIPDVYFIVISDMAPCIYKACRDCFGKKYSLIYRLFHLKKTF